MNSFDDNKIIKGEIDMKNVMFIEEHKNLVEQDKEYKYIESIKKGNYWYLKVKHLRCNKNSTIRIDSWKLNNSRPHNGNNYCCCSYEESFAYYIIEELGMNLDDVWNWEKNNELEINPYHIKKCSGKKVWMFCLEHDYHNWDREGNKVGYEIKCSNFYNGKRCNYCNSKKVHYKDSLAYNYPKIAEMIAIPENNLTFDDCYNISVGSGKYFYVKCNECNKIDNHKLSIIQIVKYGYSCKYCSDKISIPNKMLREISKQLNLNWKFEYSPKWLGNKRMDAYDDNLKIAIEMDGEYNDNHKGERKEVDNWKDEQCLEHGIYVIRINLMDTKKYRNNTLNYIKTQIINSSLSYLFDLSKVDWRLAYEKCQENKCIQAWNLWKNGIHDTKKIAKMLDIAVCTVIRYLKIGKECGKCTYTKYNYVICITTNKIFKKVTDGAEYYNIDRHGISNCCNNKCKYAGKLEDGTKLVWKKLKNWNYDNINILSWNHNKILRGKDITKLHSKLSKEVA